MNSTTTQPNLLELAKQGNAQAIATLMNRQLQPKGITVKVSLSGDCLMVVAESIEPPEQLFLVNFIRKGMTNLKIEAIKRVVVRGQATGNTARAWREAFDLHYAVPPAQVKQPALSANDKASNLTTSFTSQPKTKRTFFDKALSIIQNRKSERVLLVVGTFILASGIWGVGGLLSHYKQETKIATLKPSSTPALTLVNPVKASPSIQTASISGKVGVVMKSGDVKPVVRSWFMVLPFCVDDLRKKYSPGLSAANEKEFIQELERQYLQAEKEGRVFKFQTDLDGTYKVTGIPPGGYCISDDSLRISPGSWELISGNRSLGNSYIQWNAWVEVTPGAQVNFDLSNDNASEIFNFNS
jgi:hypothetical protein